MDVQSPALGTNEPLNGHARAVRVQPVCVLTVPHLVRRPSSIELLTAFTEREQGTTAEKKRKGVGGEVRAQLLDDAAVCSDADCEILGDVQPNAPRHVRAWCAARHRKPRPVAPHQGSVFGNQRYGRVFPSCCRGRQKGDADRHRADGLRSDGEARVVGPDECACGQSRTLEQRAPGELHVVHRTASSRTS